MHHAIPNFEEADDTQIQIPEEVVSTLENFDPKILQYVGEDDDSIHFVDI